MKLEYIESLNGYFSKLGYSLSDKLNKEEEDFRWVKVSEWSVQVQLFVSINAVFKGTHTPSRFCFSLGLYAPLISKIEEDANLSACEPESPIGLSQQLDTNGCSVSDILAAGLNWIVRNKKGMDKVSWQFDSDASNDELNLFYNTFAKYGVPFLEQIDDIQRLEHLLINLEEVNDLKSTQGISCWDEVSYLAVSLFLAGKRNKAINFLEKTMLGNYPLRVRKLIEKDPDCEKVFECRFRNVASYLARC